MTNISSHQGVLYKRRDVFTRQWRPRWFVVHPQAGILTYYLFSSDEPPSISLGTTPSRRATNNTFPESEGDNSVHYDVVPRGTIYLRGCQVELSDELSRPEEHVYCFVITAPSSSSPSSSALRCFLAARTAEARDEWVEHLTRVCQSEGEEDGGEGETPISSDPHVDPPRSSSAAAPDDVVAAEDLSTKWHDLTPDTATEGLAPAMKSQIDQVMKKYLPYVDESSKHEHEWSLLVEDRNGVTSFELKTSSSNKTMIKSTAILDHHPKQVLNLISDTKRRRDYETNVKYDQRLKRCNSHTFIDYYAFQPVWPTTAREFLVLFHWRVLQRQPHERAICIVAFSYPDANDLKPATSQYVRAHLEISLYWLELTESNKTAVIRIISYSLGGNIPQSLTNTIVQQQATMPYVISSHLKAVEPFPPPRLRQGEISDQVICEEIIDRQSDEADGMDCVRRRLQFDTQPSSMVMEEDVIADSLPSISDENEALHEEEPPSPLLLALLLISPLVLYNVMDEQANQEILFLLCAFLAVRTVVLLKLGSSFVDPPIPTGVVSCQFTVSLKGVLRYIADRRETGPAELSVVPLVVKAAGTILQELDTLNCANVKMPLLGIRGCFQRKSVHVSVVSPEAVTVKNVTELTVDDVAQAIESGRRKEKLASSWRSAVVEALGLAEQDDQGACLVVASPDSDGTKISVNVAPARGAFNVCVVLGGVRMVSPAKALQGASISSPTPKKPPAPILSVSVSMDCAAASVADCRRFAERLQELMAYPEA